MYTVYMHTTPNRKRYVGLTKNTVKKRWHSGGRGYEKQERFWRAIQKYGWDNIDHDVIASGLTFEEACELEKTLINVFRTNDRRYGYNVSEGGEKPAAGVGRTEELKKRLHDLNAGEKNPFFGHQHSPEIRKVIAQAALGNQHFRDHHHSEETRKKLSDVMKARFRRGENPRAIPVEKVKDGKVLAVFSSGREAAKDAGVSPPRMSEAIHQGRQIKGSVYRFARRDHGEGNQNVHRTAGSAKR